jgi:hypothetical protein
LILGICFSGLVFLARPFATSWFGLGLDAVVLSLIYVIAAFAVGVFGETEKRAITNLWLMIVSFAQPKGNAS